MPELQQLLEGVPFSKWSGSLKGADNYMRLCISLLLRFFLIVDEQQSRSRVHN